MTSRASYTTIAWAGMETPVALWKATGSPSKNEQWDRSPVEDGPDAERAAPAAEPAPRRNALDDDPQVEVEVEVNIDGREVAASPRPRRRRGVVRDDSTFVDLEDTISALEDRARLDDLEVVAFTHQSNVDHARIVGAYHLGCADDGNPRLLRLLRAALVLRALVGVVRWTKTSRQALGVVIAAPAGGLDVLELAWAEDVREAPERATTFVTAPITMEETLVAEELAVSMIRDSALAELRDDARVWSEELRDAARAGRVESFVVPARREGGRDVAIEKMREATKERRAA